MLDAADGRDEVVGSDAAALKKELTRPAAEPLESCEGLEDPGLFAEVLGGAPVTAAPAR